LRARALLLQREGDLAGAAAALQASAAVARTQGNALELGCTLADLAVVARARGDADLAAEADAERMAVVERIGPEIRRLGWLWTNRTS
jgi:hypothetical protein